MITEPKAVVILGAGASVDFGAPLLKGLFKDKHARLHLKTDTFLRESLEKIFWEPRGHTLETSDESLTVEELLTILHDWEEEKSECCKALDPTFCSRFRKSLYILIKKAIFDNKNTRGAFLNPLLSVARKRFFHTTWASFNWDCIFESTYWYSQTYWGPGSRSNPTLVIPVKQWTNGSSQHNLLKLHGGINWWRIEGDLTYLPWSGGGALTKKWQDYENLEALEDEPLILEPSAYKYHSLTYELLEPQWKFFFERLCDADCVIVIGYSLPENDSQARSKITVASQVNKNCRWLVVDPSEDVCRRYTRLLGHKSVTTAITSLSGFNNEIEHTLQTAFPDISFT